MGLYGAFVVRPAGHPDWAYANGASPIGQFLPSTEFVMLLSELDPALHQAIEFGQAYDATQLHPRYWLINGRAFPDTIAPNNASWLPAQPYSALIHVTVTDSLVNPTQPPALFRYLSAGALNHPFHPHGQNGTVVARDGTPLVDPTGADLSYETFSFTIGSGQTWDQTYHFDDRSTSTRRRNPIPVTIPQLQNLTFKDAATYYSGSRLPGLQVPAPGRDDQLQRVRRVLHGHAQSCAERGRQLRRCVRRDADPRAHTTRCRPANTPARAASRGDDHATRSIDPDPRPGSPPSRPPSPSSSAAAPRSSGLMGRPGRPRPPRHGPSPPGPSPVTTQWSPRPPCLRRPACQAATCTRRPAA